MITRIVFNADRVLTGFAERLQQYIDKPATAANIAHVLRAVAPDAVIAVVWNGDTNHTIEADAPTLTQLAEEISAAIIDINTYRWNNIQSWACFTDNAPVYDTQAVHDAIYAQIIDDIVWSGAAETPLQAIENDARQYGITGFIPCAYAKLQQYERGCVLLKHTYLAYSRETYASTGDPDDNVMITLFKADLCQSHRVCSEFAIDNQVRNGVKWRRVVALARR